MDHCVATPDTTSDTNYYSNIIVKKDCYYFYN